jgi:hypothetical protein
MLIKLRSEDGPWQTRKRVWSALEEQLVVSKVGRGTAQEQLAPDATWTELPAYLQKLFDSLFDSNIT